MQRWLITVYGKGDRVLDAWLIDDRTEDEAFNEAGADINHLTGVYDWTLSNVTGDMEAVGENQYTFRQEA